MSSLGQQVPAHKTSSPVYNEINRGWNRGGSIYIKDVHRQERVKDSAFSRWRIAAAAAQRAGFNSITIKFAAIILRSPCAAANNRNLITKG